MSRKVSGIVGTVAAVMMCDASAAVTQAQPNPGEALRAQSYADLLEPIPNALAVLKAHDQQQRDAQPKVELVDYYGHHHHHHHRYWRWWGDEPYYYYHHHHHHHHNYWRWGYHHHHHHHHHHHYRDWDDR